MNTFEERIAELEKQLSELKQQTVEGKREQIAAHLINKFGIEDDDIILAHTLDHLHIDPTTDVTAILAKADEAYKANALRAGIELPITAEQWCKRQAERENANELRKKVLAKLMK